VPAEAERWSVHYVELVKQENRSLERGRVQAEIWVIEGIDWVAHSFLPLIESQGRITHNSGSSAAFSAEWGGTLAFSHWILAH
jgi:hypothetical protein